MFVIILFGCSYYCYYLNLHVICGYKISAGKFSNLANIQTHACPLLQFQPRQKLKLYKRELINSFENILQCV
jgi:hypothetical protein